MADDLPRVEQEKELLSWKAKSRPYKSAEAQTRSVLIVLGTLIGLVLIFAREWMLLLVIIAGAFYYYAITRTPPEQVEYTITNKGIRAFGRLYMWWELSRWWWEEKLGTKLLALELKTGVMGRFYLPVEGIKDNEVEKVMEKYLLFEKPQITWMDKTAKWVQEKFPLENKI
jgi:hypothetical protein